MRITQQVQYAIYGLFDLAYHGESRPIRIREVSQRQGIPPRYLEQIFQRLRRAGLVASKRGPGGGYVLAKSGDGIALPEIIEAVQGEMLRLSGSDASEKAEKPEFVWDLVRARLEDSLVGCTLGELCREAAQRGVKRAENEPAMYYI